MLYMTLDRLPFSFLFISLKIVVILYSLKLSCHFKFIYGELFLLDSIFKMSWKVVLIGRIIDLTLCTFKNVIIHNELCSYSLCQRPCYPHTLECKVQDTIYDRHCVLKNLTENVTTRKFYYQRVAVNQVLILIQMTLLYSHRLPQKSSKSQTLDRRRKITFSNI